MEELTETRADAVDHSAAELRRLERDLHDGAQARLVALSMSLGMADEMFDRDPDGARRLVGDARDTTDAALAELRSVVRGHPSAGAGRPRPRRRRRRRWRWTWRSRSGSRLDSTGGCPPPVESAVYFAVAECLANVGKHAGAEQRVDPDRRTPTACCAWRSATTDVAAPTRRRHRHDAG